MAITILQNPQPFWPICNNVTWVFSSTETAQPNFSFTVEVYLNGSLLSTHEVYPENGNVAKFNITQIGRAVVSTNYPNESTLTIGELNPDDTWSLLVYEKYGTPPATQIGSSTATGSRNFLNGSFRFGDALTGGWDYQDYDIDTGGKGDLFLTDFPRNRKDLVAYQEYKYLSIINSGGDNLTGHVKLYNISGTQIASATWIGTLGTGLVTPFINVAPINLVGDTSLVQSDFDNCYYYTIQLKQTATPTKVSEIYKIYYDTSCSAYSRRRLHWINKYGAWDSFTFTLLSEDSTDVTINDYSRVTGRWNISNNYVYSLSDGHQMTLSKFVQDKLILNSDWIHQDVQQWLVRELYESPRVYLQNDFGNSNLEPVNVTNANYILKQRKKAGLIQELVQINRTYTKVSQLG
jgi:hypothetical protein